MKDRGKVVRQAVRFMIVGAIAILLHWGIYTLIKILFHLRAADDWEFTAAYTAGYVVSLLVNYQLSLKYTFHTRRSFGKGAGFVFSHAINYILHIILLSLFLWVEAGQFVVRVLRAGLPGLLRAVPLFNDPAVLVPLPVFIMALSYQSVVI